MKQRLVGAGVLVLLAVIFLPMLVKGPAPESGVSNVSLELPPAPKPDDGKPASGMITVDLPLAAPKAPASGGVTGLAAVAEPASTLAAAAEGDFAVSFGSYASVADADKVIAALRIAGLPSYQEAQEVNGKQAQRVRIGPFADRATAESARLRAGQVRSDVEIAVVMLDEVASDATPAAAKPAPQPVAAEPQAAAKPEAVPAPKPEAKSAAKSAVAEAKPAPAASRSANPVLTGFVVQIGAYASATDATVLRDALRREGFNAFTDTVPGKSGRLTRVRVGPVVTRAEADALNARLKAKTGRNGMVRSHP